MKHLAHAIRALGVLCVAAWMWHNGYHVGGGWLFVLAILLL